MIVYKTRESFHLVSKNQSFQRQVTAFPSEYGAHGLDSEGNSSVDAEQMLPLTL